MRRVTYTNTTAIDQSVIDRFGNTHTVGPGGSVTYEPHPQYFDIYDIATHLGDLWMVNWLWQTLADGARANLYIKVDNEVDIDVKILAKASGFSEIEIIEDPTVTDDGNEVTPRASKVGMTTGPKSHFYRAATVTLNTGTVIYQEYIRSGDNLQLSEFTKLQLRKDHEYIIRLTNRSGGAVNADLAMFFVELNQMMDLSPEG